MKNWMILFFGVWVLFLPASEAQALCADQHRCEGECPRGMERSESTDGYCCWPGQGWSAAQMTCVSRPDCPAGTRQAGERCAPENPWQWYGEACHEGDMQGCAWLGVWSSRQGDIWKAIDFYEMACVGGFGFACNDLGTIFLREYAFRGEYPFEPDEARGVKWLQRAAELENPAGMVNLGRMYRDARGGLEKDYLRAAELFHAACEAGHGAGCNNLGVLIDQAKIGEPDEARAVELYRLSCIRDFGLGCRNLALSYAQGSGGLDVDAVRALEYYDRACTLRNADACVSAGVVYLEGIGEQVQVDAVKALDRFARACQRGAIVGCHNLGVTLRRDYPGAPQDLESARRAFQIACEAGYEDSCQNLRSLIAAEEGEE